MTRPENERLAAIEALLKTIVDRQEEDRRYSREQHEAANKSREQVKDELARLAREHELMTKWREQKVDPFIQMGTSIKAKATGVILALGIIGGIVWAGLQYFKEQILGVIWP
jgi:hypothetical protein